MMNRGHQTPLWACLHPFLLACMTFIYTGTNLKLCLNIRQHHILWWECTLMLQPALTDTGWQDSSLTICKYTVNTSFFTGEFYLYAKAVWKIGPEQNKDSVLINTHLHRKMKRMILLLGLLNKNWPSSRGGKNQYSLQWNGSYPCCSWYHSDVLSSQMMHSKQAHYPHWQYMDDASSRRESTSLSVVSKQNECREMLTKGGGGGGGGRVLHRARLSLAAEDAQIATHSRTEEDNVPHTLQGLRRLTVRALQCRLGVGARWRSATGVKRDGRLNGFSGAVFQNKSVSENSNSKFQYSSTYLLFN